jgi:hypothetical protein
MSLNSFHLPDGQLRGPVYIIDGRFSLFPLEKNVPEKVGTPVDSSVPAIAEGVRKNLLGQIVEEREE